MKKIAILGYGLEGKSNYQYWKDKGEVTIVDERQNIADLPRGAKTILGAEAFRSLDEFDVVVRSAGIAPYKITSNVKVWSATNEFFAKCPAPIIGVTGSKGKGTTSSLIAEILRASGHRVHLVGNIGVPALSVLQDVRSDDVVIYELSSFQLWDIEMSPHIAAVLPIEPDHLDVHHGMDDYVSAKSHIATYQQANDSIIYYSRNRYAQQIAALSQAKMHIAYPFALPEQIRSALRLPGAHNQDNLAAAVAAARAFDAAITEQQICRSLARFDGLDHRLKFVRTVKNVSYFDDSIATTPGSALAAIKAFDQPKVLILGGQDKGADYVELLEVCQTTGTKVLTIGANGEAIYHLAQQHGVEAEYIQGSMQEIVQRASQMAPEHSAVILSPASASFDMFRNYQDRGDQFIAAVQAIAE